MSPGRLARHVSRRRLMYLLVAVQMLVLGSIVAPQELNIALDSGPSADLEIVQARVRKDPFRGASVSGASALDLDGRAAAVPPGRLRAGDRVLVHFAVEPGRTPRITRVERRAGGGPPFSATAFTIPGTVAGGPGRVVAGSDGGLLARIGSPAIPVELELPASIPVDDAVAAQLVGPSLVRARLHRGFLEHRFLDDIRLIGRGWEPEVSFTLDEARARLLVLAPRDVTYRRPAAPDAGPRTDVFVFDDGGHEVERREVPGRVIEGAVDPTDGSVLALVADQRWAREVALARIGPDGAVLQRSAPLALDRILGFDPATAGVWTLVGLAPPRSKPPHFVERTTLGGPRGPRLGPFASVPRSVLSHDGEAWVVETEQHRVTRLDLATGGTRREYRDLNGPTGIAVDAGSLLVIEASRTQLTRFSPDGRVLWRVPRFGGLAWILPDPGTGGGWLGAGMFEGRAVGVLRYGPDGSITPIERAGRPEGHADWRRRRMAADAVRSARSGRLYFLERTAIVILGPDGAPVRRVDGFRFAGEQQRGG